MNTDSVEFYLPLGLSHNGNLYRRGHMHLATTQDELEIQATDEVGMNTRYRDIMLLSRVIDDIDGLSPISIELIEELFEADFLYLQLLYRELNGESESRITSTCPSCGQNTTINIPRLYEDMGIYKEKRE